MKDKEKLVSLTMMHAQDIKPWDLVVFYDMILNFPEEIISQWTARYGYRDELTVNVPSPSNTSSWEMIVQVTTIGELAHEIFAYWYDYPSKELYTPAREWIDNWQKVCTDNVHRIFYEDQREKRNAQKVSNKV